VIVLHVTARKPLTLSRPCHPSAPLCQASITRVHSCDWRNEGIDKSPDRSSSRSRGHLWNRKLYWRSGRDDCIIAMRVCGRTSRTGSSQEGQSSSAPKSASRRDRVATLRSVERAREQLVRCTRNCLASRQLSITETNRLVKSFKGCHRAASKWRLRS
jgi:hypothetical protein